ncbi:MAG TPA: Gfo/Idh/MocA family oxidoreductase [Dongiaceae bacterium]|nr:Gfo/Idh/MocA family oxidoreductase [Dongiaceae bacterium]
MTTPRRFSPQRPLRWGMIGCGAVTEKKSAPALRLAHSSQLLAVYSRTFEKAQDYARRHQVPRVYASAAALLQDSDIDAIYIATPPDSHLTYALQVADAGKICCVEKPMALNARECEQMVEAFAQRGLPLFVAYYRRSLPRFQQVKQWLDENRIGAVRHVQWTYCRPPSDWDLTRTPQWRVQPAIAGGGYFMDLACHGLDLLLHLLGDIAQVSGFVANQQQLYPADDAVTACWQFSSGATGNGFWNFGARQRQDEVLIVGSRGEIRFSVFLEQPVRLDSVDETLQLTIPHPDPIQLQHVENILRHLNGDIEHPSTGVSALRTAQVMDAILGR